VTVWGRFGHIRGKMPTRKGKSGTRLGSRATKSGRARPRKTVRHARKKQRVVKRARKSVKHRVLQRKTKGTRAMKGRGFGKQFVRYGIPVLAGAVGTQIGVPGGGTAVMAGTSYAANRLTRNWK